jgi:hypothetical protein
MNWEELAIKAEFKELIKIAGEESFSEEDKQAIIERVKEKLRDHGVSNVHAENLILEGDSDGDGDAELVASASSKIAASIIAEENTLSDLGLTKDTEITSDNIDQIMDYFKGQAKEEDSADEIIKSLDGVFDRIKLLVDSLGGESKGVDDEELAGNDKKKEASLKCAEKNILSDFIVDELVKYAKRFEYQSELDKYLRDHPDADRLDHSYDKKGESGKGRPRNSKLWPTKNQMETYLDNHPKADKSKHQYKKDDKGNGHPDVSKVDQGGGSGEEKRRTPAEKEKEFYKDNPELDGPDLEILTPEQQKEKEDARPISESPEKQKEIRDKIEEVKEKIEAEKSGEKPSDGLEDSHIEKDTPHWFNENENIDPLNNVQMEKKGFEKGFSDLMDEDVFYDVRTGKAHKFSDLPKKVREKLAEKASTGELWHSQPSNNRKNKLKLKETAPLTEGDKDKGLKENSNDLFSDKVNKSKKDFSKEIVKNEKEIRDTMVDEGKVIGDLFNKFREKRNQEILDNSENPESDVLFDKNDEAYHFEKPQAESDKGMLPSSRKPERNDSVMMKSQKGKGPAWNVEKIEGDTAFLRNEKTDKVMQSPLNQLEFSDNSKSVKKKDTKDKPLDKKKMTMKDFLENVPNEEALTDRERKIVEKMFDVPEKESPKKESPKKESPKKESPKKEVVEKTTDKIVPKKEDSNEPGTSREDVFKTLGFKQFTNKNIGEKSRGYSPDKVKGAITSIYRNILNSRPVHPPTIGKLTKKELEKTMDMLGISHEDLGTTSNSSVGDIAKGVVKEVSDMTPAYGEESVSRRNTRYSPSSKREEPKKDVAEKNTDKIDPSQKDNSDEKPPAESNRRVKPKPSARLQKIGDGDYQHEGKYSQRIQKSGGGYSVSTKDGNKILPAMSFKNLAGVRSWIGSVNQGDIVFDGKSWQDKTPEKDLVEKVTDKIVPKKEAPKKDVVEKVTDKIVPKKEAPKKESPKKKDDSFKDFEETLDPKTVSKIVDAYGDGVNNHITDYLDSNNIKLDKKQQDALWHRVDALGMEEVGSGSYNEQSSLDRIEGRLPSIMDAITNPKKETPKKETPKKDVVEKITDKIAPKKVSPENTVTKVDAPKGEVPKLDPNKEPKGGPRQTFHFGNKEWDIDQGLRYVEEKGLKPESVKTDDLKGYLGIVKVDQDYASKLTNKEPLLAITSEDGSMVVDGYHRIQKAVNDGVENLDVVFLNDKQSKDIEIPDHAGARSKAHNDFYKKKRPSKKVAPKKEDSKKEDSKKTVTKKEVSEKKSPEKGEISVSHKDKKFDDTTINISKYESPNGKIEIFNNSPWAGGRDSITETTVNKDFRRNGEGSRILKKALEGRTQVSAQTSSKGSTTFFYNNGFRPVEKPDASLKETVEMFNENQSLGMEWNAKKETPKKDVVEKVTDKIVPKKEAPKKETPKKETPKKETPKKETPKKEAPKKEAPKKETPKKETPKVEDLKKRREELHYLNDIAEKKIRDFDGEKKQNGQYRKQYQMDLDNLKEQSESYKRTIDRINDGIDKESQPKKDVVEKITDRIAPKKESPKKEESAGGTMVKKFNDMQNASKAIADHANAKMMHDGAKKKHDDYSVSKTKDGKVVKKSQKIKDDLKKDLDVRRKKMDDLDKSIPAEFKGKTLSDMSKMTGDLYTKIKKGPSKSVAPKSVAPKKVSPKKETTKSESGKHYDSLKSMGTSAERRKYVKDQMSDKSLSKSDQAKIHEDYSKLMKDEKDDFSDQLMVSQGDAAKTKKIMDHISKTRGDVFAEGVEKMVDKKKKEAPKKVAPKKVEPKKEAPKKDVVEKITDKIAPKAVEPKREAPKTVTPKKEAPKKEAPKKEAPKKEAPKKVEPRKVEPKKVEPKKVEPKKEAPKKVEPKKETPKKDLVEKVTDKIAPKEESGKHYNSLKSMGTSTERRKYITDQMSDKSLSKADKKNIHEDYKKLMKDEKDDFSQQLMVSQGDKAKTKKIMDHMSKTRGQSFAEGVESMVEKRMKDGEEGKLVKKIMDSQGDDDKINKIMDEIIETKGEDFADGIGDMVKNNKGKIPVREKAEATAADLNEIEAAAFLEGMTDRLVEAVKDRDLMRDTGGQSKMRDREPHNKPPRDDCKSRYRNKRLTPDERDRDTDNDKDLN